jgi:hypothetical protein
MFWNPSGRQPTASFPWRVKKPKPGWWVAEQALIILKGKAASVAVDIRRKAMHQQLSPNQRKPVDKCADYLTKYLPMLEYDLYLSEGLPIATGVIEGACRHLIKDRMDLTGVRWRLKRAEAVLRIRSLRSSGDFEAYWAFHIVQEHQRNYLLSRCRCRLRLRIDRCHLGVVQKDPHPSHNDSSARLCRVAKGK